MIAALQQSGDIATVIDSKVAAEAVLRTAADSALDTRVLALEADPTTQALLTAEASARAAGDSALSSRVDILEADPTTQVLLNAESAARAAGHSCVRPGLTA